METLIATLLKSPLFNLSLSSKELFHSNFIAWLGNLYPEEVGEILFKTKLSNSENETLAVQRELNNLDLVFNLSDESKVIIENKFKSIATNVQLDEYKNKVKNQSNLKFYLLALSEPPFFINGNYDVWEFMSNSKLSYNLLRVRDNISKPYHKDIIEDYSEFISKIDELNTNYILLKENELYDYYSENSPSNKFREIRLHDLYFKGKSEQIAYKIFEQCQIAYGKENVIFGRIKSKKKGQIIINSGMTRATGLIDVEYYEGAGNSKLIQIQGYQYRKAIVNSHAKEVAENLISNNEWFQFDHINETTDVYPLKGGFNKFGKNFLYRHKLLLKDNKKETYAINEIVEFAILDLKTIVNKL